LTLLDKKSQLEQLLWSAITEVIIRLESQDERVYALVFYPSSGYRNIGIAYATRAYLERCPGGTGPELDPDLVGMLADHPDLLQQASSHRRSEFYYEVNACEWDCVDAFSDLFSDVNDAIETLFEALYENDDDVQHAEEFYESLLTNVLLRVRSSGLLKDSPDTFAEDMLLGVQFPDSTNGEAVKRISKAVNSVEWHEKLSEAYGI